MVQRPGPATKALDSVRQEIESDPEDDRDWVRDLYEQAGRLRDRVLADPVAVRQELLSGMDEQMRRHKLPPSGWPFGLPGLTGLEQSI
jgi:hypothetical protein